MPIFDGQLSAIAAELENKDPEEIMLQVRGAQQAKQAPCLEWQWQNSIGLGKGHRRRLASAWRPLWRPNPPVTPPIPHPRATVAHLQPA